MLVQALLRSWLPSPPLSCLTTALNNQVGGQWDCEPDYSWQLTRCSSQVKVGISQNNTKNSDGVPGRTVTHTVIELFSQ